MVATNAVASRLPERQMTGTLHARAKTCKQDEGLKDYLGA